MPHYKDPFTKGNLYIKFNVEFPNKIPKDYVAQLKKILPSSAKPKIVKGQDVEEVYLQEPVLDQQQANGRRKEAYMSDDEEDDRHHVQCPVS